MMPNDVPPEPSETPAEPHPPPEPVSPPTEETPADVELELAAEPAPPQEVYSLEIQAVEAPPAPPPVPVGQCWRCEHWIQEGLPCRYCGARPRTPTGQPAKPELTTPLAKQPPRVLGVILAYVLFLLTSLVWAGVLHSSKDQSDDFIDRGTVVIEIIDFLFTLFLFLWLGRFHVRKPKVPVRVATWIVAPVVSIGLFFLGKWYVDALRDYVNAGWLNVEDHWKFTLYYITVIAVQPAVVEELFFRYFAFGALRQVTNTHSAVFLTAIMFALAHLYNPLGLPFLFLMGVAFGYARAYSGGLLLPMLMHFGHNLAILWVESNQ